MDNRFWQWCRVWFFRLWTAAAVLAAFGWAFFYRPDLLKWWSRTTTKMVERASELLPYPYGDQFEVAVRGFGASIWFQITLAIVLLRVFCWLIARTWRRG